MVSLFVWIGCTAHQHNLGQMAPETGKMIFAVSPVQYQWCIQVLQGAFYFTDAIPIASANVFIYRTFRLILKRCRYDENVKGQGP
jgi:hypothetical protein